MKILETDRLVLRVLSPADADMIITLLNQPDFIQNIGDKGVRDFESACEYIETGPIAMQQALGFSLYCCQLKSSGEPIGMSGLIKREGVEYPEVGYSFLSQYQRKGYGKESVAAVIEYARSQLALKCLNAICNPSNSASIALLEGQQFKKKGLVSVPNIDQEVVLFERFLN
ncbi:GNAT family N-acetyltransferase [Thalassotalea fusca]